MTAITTYLTGMPCIPVRTVRETKNAAIASGTVLRLGRLFRVANPSVSSPFQVC